MLVGPGLASRLPTFKDPCGGGTDDSRPLGHFCHDLLVTTPGLVHAEETDRGGQVERNQRRDTEADCGEQREPGTPHQYRQTDCQTADGVEQKRRTDHEMSPKPSKYSTRWTSADSRTPAAATARPTVDAFTDRDLDAMSAVLVVVM